MHFPDGKLLQDYAVIDGSKVTLVVKKYAPGVKRGPALLTQDSPKKSVIEEERPVWSKMRVFLRRHFHEKDAEAVLNEFKKVCIYH